MGLITNAIQVTISGQGFGSNPTLNAGSKVLVSNVTAVSDAKVTVTFTSKNDASASGNQGVTVTASNVSSANNNFFVQIPSQLQLLFQRVSLTNGTPNGCPAVNVDPEGPFGMKLTLRYQVLDQQSPGKPIDAAMPIREDLINFVVDGQPQPGGTNLRVTLSDMTDSDGTFIDEPVGACAQAQFGTATFTQRLFIPLTIQVSPTVRTNNFSQTGKKGCGSSTNSSDINVRVLCN